MRVRAGAVRSKGSFLYFDHFIIAVDLVLDGARLSRAGGEPVLFDAILSVISERCNTLLGFFFSITAGIMIRGRREGDWIRKGGHG